MKTSTVITLALLVSLARLATAAEADATDEAKRDARSMTTALSKRGVEVTVGRAGAQPPEWTGQGSRPQRTDANHTFVAVGTTDNALTPRWPERLLACHVTGMVNVQLLADVVIDALVPDRPNTTRNLSTNQTYLTHSAQRWGEPAFELVQHLESTNTALVDEGLATSTTLAFTRVTLPVTVMGLPGFEIRMASINSMAFPEPMEMQQLVPVALNLDEAKLNRALDFFARSGFRLTRVHLVDNALFCEVQLSEADLKRAIKQAATTAAKE